MKAYQGLIILLFPVLIFSQIENNSWETKFELSGGLETANYENSVNYFERLAAFSDKAKMVEFGVSPQGRKLYYLIVDKDRDFEPGLTDKPVVMIQNGIHAGEIEGKDACMLLLREILVTKEKAGLLDNLTLIIIPVFNVDGHERISKYNRINQNGPIEMGWRTTAQNLNLNRDYTKADAPEMGAFLRLYSSWLPDFFIDTHTTNGLDFQYVLTYGMEKHQTVRENIRQWTRNEFLPYFENTLNERGVLTAPYFSFDERKPLRGVTDWVSPPRFSHGYTAFQNRIGLLLETHMLKPYADRVYATKQAIEVVLEYVNQNPLKIKTLSEEADELAVASFFEQDETLPLEFEPTEQFEEFIFHGFTADSIKSEITNSKVVEYSDRKYSEPIKYYSYQRVLDSIDVPNGYIVPLEWSEIVEIMMLHGIEVEQFDKGKEFIVEEYKFSEYEFANTSYEGRQRVNGDYLVRRDTIISKTGDYYISLNQRCAALIIHLLEPKGVDSFLRWGFFNAIFERKEYFEYYSMQPIAQKMYEEDEELRRDFERKVLEDEEFKNSPWLRMNFFYEQSPYFDDKYKVYPVLRVVDEL